jgi:hypothetical protein
VQNELNQSHFCKNRSKPKGEAIFAGTKPTSENAVRTVGYV